MDQSLCRSQISLIQASFCIRRDHNWDLSFYVPYQQSVTLTDHLRIALTELKTHSAAVRVCASKSRKANTLSESESSSDLQNTQIHVCIRFLWHFYSKQVFDKSSMSSLFPGVCVVQKDFLSFLSTWWAELLQGVITSEWRAAGCRWANFNSPQNGKNLKWSKMSRGCTALLRSCDRDTAWSGEATATTKLTKLTAVWVMGTDIERLFLEAMGWVMP